MNLRFDEIFTFFFQSIGMFMSLFFFIQYFINGKKDHLFYALYLATLTLYCFVAMPEYFFDVVAGDPVSERPYDIYKRPVQYLSSIFYTYFVLHYLGLHDPKDKLRRIFNALLILYVVAAIVFFILNLLWINYDPVYFVLSLLLMPVQVYVLAAMFRSKIPYSSFIIWGSMITITGSLGSLVMTIYVKTNVAATDITNYHIFLPAQLATLVDMFLYSIALQKKLADTEKSMINMAFQRQQAILLERERIIGDLHDDVGGGLSSIRMMSDLMVGQGNLGKQETVFARKISNTAREIAQRMHTIIWSLNQENDRVDNFVEYVRQFGLGFFEGSPVKFVFQANVDHVRDLQISGAWRKNFFLIIKEALHNILKHSGATEAKVIIEVFNGNMRVLISDNGKGFTPLASDQLHSFSNGLRNMHKRAEEIDGSIQFRKVNGTTIEVVAPMK